MLEMFEGGKTGKNEGFGEIFHVYQPTWIKMTGWYVMERTDKRKWGLREKEIWIIFMKILCISLTLPMCPSDGVDVIGTDSRTPFLAPYLNVVLVCGSCMIMTTEQSLY